MRVAIGEGVAVLSLRHGLGDEWYFSTEVAGGFTGVMMGLYATGNGRDVATPADFAWFDDRPDY